MTRRTAAFGVLKCVAFAAIAVAPAAQTQVLIQARLPAEQLPVAAPADRVQGAPGQMRIAERACRADYPQPLRQRIVEVAIQEWGFFGFGVVDQTRLDEGTRDTSPRQPRQRRVSWLQRAESERVADSIAGYWAVTSDGDWILDRQNAIWNGPDGIGARWRDPWSAAFISWVMCESGLGEAAQFRRGIAHHTYIDQAIQARDDPGSNAAYLAYDVGEQPVEPGDLLCSARRSAYRSIADRRQHLGVGVRSHCDIVVTVDAANDRILAIGGNVRGAVNLKLLFANFVQRNGQPAVDSVGLGRRAVFAHLKLRTARIEPDALQRSPTLKALDARSKAWLETRLRGDPPTPRPAS